MISVLMPAYNAEKYVVAAIESVLSQTYSNFELLVADDASTDRTREVIDGIADPRIKCLHNPKNLGKTGTVAKLFDYAKGEYITIHDADDISLPERFEKQVAEFREHPELGMCGTSFIGISEDGSAFTTVHMQSDYIQILAEIDQQSQFHGPTMMIKRAVLDELGEIYRPYFDNYNEDTDLAYRIAEKHLSYNLPEPLYQYRIVPTSLSQQESNVRRRNFYKAVVFLAKERKEHGMDSLAEGKPEVVDRYMAGVNHRYEVDSSLIYREAAAHYMYWKYYRRAIKESWLAVKMNPLQATNIRTLLYCVRKALLSFPKRVMHGKSHPGNGNVPRS